MSPVTNSSDTIAFPGKQVEGFCSPLCASIAKVITVQPYVIGKSKVVVLHNKDGIRECERMILPLGSVTCGLETVKFVHVQYVQ
jgi:hypothetical protein